MKRRSKAASKAGKSAPLKCRRTAPKAVPGRRSATTTQETEVSRLARERDEALEQQAATSEILQLISSTLADLQSVFAAILESAVRICDASFGDIGLWEDGAIRLVAIHKMTPPAFVEERKRTSEQHHSSHGGLENAPSYSRSEVRRGLR